MSGVLLITLLVERRNAHVAQLVERILGKDEVVSSILTMSSTPLSAYQSRDVAQSGSALEWGSRGR